MNRRADEAERVRDRRLYARLRRELELAGALRPAPLASALHMSIVFGVYLGAYLLLLREPDWDVRIALLVLVAAAGVQSGFIAHQVGHQAVSRKRSVSRLLGHLFLSFVNGYADTQYQRKHHAHHLHANRAGVDPDIEGDGLLTFYEASAEGKRGPLRLLTRWQAYLIWPLLLFVVFSARKDSIQAYLVAAPGRHPAEQVALAAHYALWLGPPAVLLGPGEALLHYAIVACLMGPYLGVTVLVNHLGMPILDSPWRGSRLRRTLVTTRNLGSGWLRDYFFAGTNNHVEHHLFPQIPIHRLGLARQITRDFCTRHQLPYAETTWPRAMCEVFDHLRQMSLRARRAWGADPGSAQPAGRGRAML